MATSADHTLQGFPIRSLVVLGAVGAVVVQYRLLDSYLLFWALAVALLGYALWRELRRGDIERDSATAEVPEDGYLNITAFVAGTFMLVAFAVLASLYSLDDAFYATLTNGLLDHPELPALSRDTMFAGGTYPLLVPVFKAESLDALYAVLADFSGMDQSLFRYVIMRPIFALMSGVALALLFRLFIPRDWGVAVLLCVILAFLHADTYRTIGGFMTSQFGNGKINFVGIMVPVVIWAAINFIRNPSLDRWAILFLAQAASVGMTPNAIYVVPVTSGIALLAATPWNKPDLTKLIAGLAASFWPVLVGLVLLVTQNLQSSPVDPIPTMDESLKNSLGYSIGRWILFAGLLASWIFVKHAPTRRILLTLSVASLLFVLNPLTSDLVAQYLTGGYNWRLTWSIPFFAMTTILIIAGSRAVLRSVWPVWALIALLIPTAFLWSESRLAIGRTSMEFSVNKFPPEHVLAVNAIGNHVRRPEIFLAPRDVSAISVMRRSHPYPLVPRPAYLSFAADTLSGEEIAKRMLLLRLIAPNEIETGSGPLIWEGLVEQDLVSEGTWENKAKKAFVMALQKREIALYAVPVDNPMNEYLKVTFSAYGYSQQEIVSDLVLWTR